MKGKISVIIPVYNTEKYVRKCIESILGQTYRNFELIIIDDGSVDDSLNVINGFSDERIQVISKKNEGVSATRNLGLDVATGEYILFIDSDDWIEQDMLEVLINNIVKTGADISCCQSDYKIQKSITELEVWNKDKTIEEFLIHKIINGSLVNKLINRKFVDNIRFDKNVRYGEDALFLWNALNNIQVFCITNRVLYHQTLHDDSSTGGGFRPIRMESHQVWDTICKGAQINKQYYKLAKAQLANMAFFSWYSMKLSRYNNTVYENECIKIITRNLKYLLFVGFISIKVKVCTLWLLIFPKLINALIEKKINKKH